MKLAWGSSIFVVALQMVYGRGPNGERGHSLCACCTRYLRGDGYESCIQPRRALILFKSSSSIPYGVIKITYLGCLRAAVLTPLVNIAARTGHIWIAT